MSIDAIDSIDTINSIISVNSVVVVGLGYVGLPLSVAFGKRLNTIGFDVDADKIDAYNSRFDPAGLVSRQDFESASHLHFTSDPTQIGKGDIIIIAVPTPIDDAKEPDLKFLESASTIVGKNMKRGAIVVYESTVYPGVTEEFCASILESSSGLKAGEDFRLAYSPERINPGDPDHTLEKIVKVVAAQDEETLEAVTKAYELIVEAGVYRADSIRVAEAAKVIENTQRDLNIALMNELAIIFNAIGIDTLKVLEAAGTKWNFLPFRPGLVGGHCIGVDPYYLTHLAKKVGYHPEVILAGRRINDYMGIYIAQCTVKELLRQKFPIQDVKVAVLGLTFKEDCPDLRNSRVVDIVRELMDYGITPILHDPIAAPKEVEGLFGLPLERTIWDNGGRTVDFSGVDAIILAVCHKEYKDAIHRLITALKTKEKAVFIDVKSSVPIDTFKETNIVHWRL